MTQDDIIVMAVNAGANSHFVKHHIAFIEKLANLVAAKECEWLIGYIRIHKPSCEQIANAIRARGEA